MLLNQSKDKTLFRSWKLLSNEDEHSEESSLKRRGFPETYFQAKPVKIGEEIEVNISEVSKRGDGVTRVEGYVIFISDTKQGDNVKVRITQIRPNYAIAQIVQPPQQ